MSGDWEAAGGRRTDNRRDWPRRRGRCSYLVEHLDSLFDSNHLEISLFGRPSKDQRRRGRTTVERVGRSSN